jgi:hypothetical protein
MTINESKPILDEDAEIVKAMAEESGWTQIRPSGRLDGQMVGYPPNNPIIGKPQPLENYLEDRNAVARAIAYENNRMSDCDMIHALAKIVGADMTERSYADISLLLWSTPRQQVEAFLKVKRRSRMKYGITGG